MSAQPQQNEQQIEVSVLQKAAEHNLARHREAAEAAEEQARGLSLLQPASNDQQDPFERARRRLSHEYKDAAKLTDHIKHALTFAPEEPALLERLKSAEELRAKALESIDPKQVEAMGMKSLENSAAWQQQRELAGQEAAANRKAEMITVDMLSQFARMERAGLSSIPVFGSDAGNTITISKILSDPHAAAEFTMLGQMADAHAATLTGQQLIRMMEAAHAQAVHYRDNVPELAEQAEDAMVAAYQRLGASGQRYALRDAPEAAASAKFTTDARAADSVGVASIQPEFERRAPGA